MKAVVESRKASICLTYLWLEKRRCSVTLLFNFVLEHAYGKVQTNQEPEINWHTSASGVFW